MSGAFDQALGHLMVHEGALSSNAADPGGLTKYGISKRSYPDLDIASLTMEQAAAIYRRDYRSSAPRLAETPH